MHWLYELKVYLLHEDMMSSGLRVNVLCSGFSDNSSPYWSVKSRLIGTFRDRCLKFKKPLFNRTWKYSRFFSVTLWHYKLYFAIVYCLLFHIVND